MKRKALLMMLIVVTMTVAVCNAGDAMPAAGQNLAEQTQSVPVDDAGSYIDIRVEEPAAVVEVLGGHPSKK